jgi:hypothetical protein
VAVRLQWRYDLSGLQRQYRLQLDGGRLQWERQQTEVTYG